MKKRNRSVLFYWIICCFAPIFSFAESRGLWVTRYDFKSVTDIVQIMENARFLGANQVFFQVRGNATVFYPSKIEPWAWELNDGTPNTIGIDPGWNPLQTALDEAEKQGLELHAWLNVFPGWRGVIPAPRGTDQPWASHRSWFMIDHKGALLRPSRSFYSFMSPGHPAVRAHLAKVFGEIASLYPNLSGIHMDYVRYPGRTEIGGFRDFSYERESVDAFKKTYKKSPHFSQPEWQRFKCEQVNASILAIRNAVRDASPTMKLSGTCFANIHSATEEKGQDPRDWLEKDLVDWVVPMVYERSEKAFVSRLSEWNKSFEEKRFNQMLVGINVDFNKEDEIVKQLKRVEEFPYGGVILFAYSSLFPNHKGNRKADAVRAIWQEQHLKELLKSTIPLPSQ